MDSVYRFALRPAWLVSHVFVLALIVVLVNLGLWQLQRLDERQSRNAEVSARTELDAVPVEDLVGADPDDAQYRRVTATGTYVEGADLLIDNRSLDGLPGAWVVTPLVLADGDVVTINRGFAGVGDDGRVTPPAAPAGEVTVEGTVATFASRSCATRVDDRSRVVGAACLSSDAVEVAFGVDVAGVVVQATESSPADDPFLSVVPLPEPGDGPHLSYAVQWFIFTTVAIVGYPLILRKNARERAAADTAGDHDDDEDDLDRELRALLGDG